MKITRELRKEINAAVRANVHGASPLAEIGMRGNGEHYGANALRWALDDDLDGLYKLADVHEINDDPAHPGCAELDLYVTTGTGIDRELETNVGILIRDGHVVAAHANGIKLVDAKYAINFPIAPWDGEPADGGRS